MAIEQGASAIDYSIDSQLRLRVLTGLVPLVDDMWSLSAKLESFGLGGHNVILNLCKEIGGESLLTEYSIFLMESAKECISSGAPGKSQSYYGTMDGYRSPWLEERRAKRNALVGERLSPETYTRLALRLKDELWLLQIDPLKSVLDRIRTRDFLSFQGLMESVASKRGAARQGFGAAQGHSSSPNRALTTNLQRVDYVRNLFSHSLSGLGYNEEKGVPVMLPTFRRNVCGVWDIALIIQGTLLGSSVARGKRKSGDQGRGRHQASGELRVFSHIRHSADQSKLQKDPRMYIGPQFIPVKFQECVPDFGSTYCSFDSDDEIAACVQAHLITFEALHDKMLTAITTGLEPPTTPPTG